MRNMYLKAFEFSAFSIAFLSVFYVLSTFDFFSFDVLSDFIKGFGVYAYAAYVLIFLLVSFTGVAITPLVLLSVAMFSAPTAFALSFIAHFGGSIIGFEITRFVKKHELRKYHPTYALHFPIIEKLKLKLASKVEHSTFTTAFFIKFVFSNMLVSYVFGLLEKRVNRNAYYLGSFFNNMVFVFLLVVFGEVILKNLQFGVLLLALVFLTGYLYSHFFRNKYKLNAS